MSVPHEIVIVGGSAGSLQMVAAIVAALPREFPFTLIFVLHRQRNVSSDLVQLLKPKDNAFLITEPDDKERIKPGAVYVAPQNYHLLADDGFFSLDYSEPVMFSRPSIDVSFESFALMYGKQVTGIILAGANGDGTDGLVQIVKHGGIAVAQAPETASYPAMPRSAIEKVHPIFILSPDEIVKLIATKNK